MIETGEDRELKVYGHRRKNMKKKIGDHGLAIIHSQIGQFSKLATGGIFWPKLCKKLISCQSPLKIEFRLRIWTLAHWRSWEGSWHTIREVKEEVETCSTTNDHWRWFWGMNKRQKDQNKITKLINKQLQQSYCNIL